PAPVAGRVQPAGERVLAGPADALETRVVSTGRRPVHRVHLGAGQRREVGVTYPPGGHRLVQSRLPAPSAFLDLLRVHGTPCGRIDLLGRPSNSILRAQVAGSGAVHVTARADYAVRAVVQLASIQPATATRHQLAEAQDIPGKFLETILGDLRRAGLLEAQRGAAGG